MPHSVSPYNSNISILTRIFNPKTTYFTSDIINKLMPDLQSHDYMVREYWGQSKQQASIATTNINDCYQLFERNSHLIVITRSILVGIAIRKSTLMILPTKSIRKMLTPVYIIAVYRVRICSFVKRIHMCSHPIFSLFRNQSLHVLGYYKIVRNEPILNIKKLKEYHGSFFLFPAVLIFGVCFFQVLCCLLFALRLHCAHFFNLFSLLYFILPPLVQIKELTSMPNLIQFDNYSLIILHCLLHIFITIFFLNFSFNRHPLYNVSHNGLIIFVCPYHHPAKQLILQVLLLSPSSNVRLHQQQVDTAAYRFLQYLVSASALHFLNQLNQVLEKQG